MKWTALSIIFLRLVTESLAALIVGSKKFANESAQSIHRRYLFTSHPSLGCRKMTMLALWSTSRCTRADKLVTFPVPSTPKSLCCGLFSWAVLCCQTIILSYAFSAKIVTAVSQGPLSCQFIDSAFFLEFYMPNQVTLIHDVIYYLK